MSDDQMMGFLIQLAGYMTHLHERSRVTAAAAPEKRPGPDFMDDCVNWEDEGFSRWMGWRGKEEQEREVRNKRAEP